MKLLRDRTEFEEVPITLHDPSTKDGISTTAILIKSVKEMWTKHYTGPWPSELWVAADEALKRGEVVPDPRYPVVISDREEEGPITSPGIAETPRSTGSASGDEDYCDGPTR